MIKNPDKAKQYSDTNGKYLELGHATKLSTTEFTPTNNMTYYIPRHYVTNPNKQNKFRVVFDASAKFAGTSLNDYLLKVLDLLNSSVTAGKVSKYGVFLVGIFLYLVRIQEIMDQKKIRIWILFTQ